MYKLIAAGAVATVTLMGAGPALADSQIEGENCVEVDESATVNGVTVRTGRQVVCESHHVSRSGVSGSARFGFSTPSVSGLENLIPAGPGGGGGVPPWEIPQTPAELADLIEDLRRHADDVSDGDADVPEAYRHLVEDHVGGDVYENEVCDDASGYGEELDCWATDYLLGDYVSNALIGWVEDTSPVPLPPVATGLVRTVIKKVVDTTNEPPPSIPPAPAVPALPSVPALPL